MDFIPGLVAPRVGVLDRTGLTILVCLFLFSVLLFIVKNLVMVIMSDQMSNDICWDIMILIHQNFNWYQSRHPVLFLGEILGKILSGS